MKLTKAALIDRIYATNPKMTKDHAREAVEAILHILQSSLENGEDILLSGFGKFNVKTKRARKGRNPKTNEPMMLEGRKVVTFRPSGILRDKVNGK